jgi:CubicO group peptidase (beta-lactamase class C family)
MPTRLRTVCLVAIALAFNVLTASAQSPLDEKRLERLDRTLQQYVDDNRIGGVVALVLFNGKPVYERALGWRDKEAERRMEADSIFRIASQTKALTSVAILALMEEGKLSLGEPVSRYIPTFDKTTVAVTNAGQVTMAPATRRITIRDLLTHTSGMSYGTDASVAALYEQKGLGPAAGFGWYTADKDEPVCTTMERLGTLPFVAQPGERYVYGYNTDVLGCVAERAAGQPLDEIFRTRLTGPLDMKDTHFFLPASQRNRLVTVYSSGADGKITRASNDAKGQGHYVEGPRKSFSGGAGLVSTARDYARFLEMIRRGGELDGVRVLSPRTVQLMTTNQIGTMHSTTGLGYGYGFQTTDRFGANGLDAVGSFGWGGAYGSNYRVDPGARLTLVLMMNQIPNSTDVAERFRALVYSALIESANR